jgi:SAM-dependent methyltransferase
VVAVADRDLAARVESAVRSHYETTENFDRRRGMSEYALGPTPHRRLVEQFTWAPTATVLDVGCGDGVWASAAVRFTPRGTVTGYDMSRGMLRAARERDEHIRAVQGDANRLPFADGSVDVVLAAWMLYHVDFARALPEFVRVLRPDGRCIATTNDRELLPGIEEIALAAAQDVAGADVASPLGFLRFNVDNGAEILGQVFEHVETIVHDLEYDVPIPDPILSFTESLRAPAQARLGAGFDFDAFLAAFRTRLDERLQSGPIRISRKVAFFVASGAVEVV